MFSCPCPQRPSGHSEKSLNPAGNRISPVRPVAGTIPTELSRLRTKLVLSGFFGLPASRIDMSVLDTYCCWQLDSTHVNVFGHYLFSMVMHTA
jgi:hypothetical protein